MYISIIVKGTENNRHVVEVTNKENVTKYETQINLFYLLVIDFICVGLQQFDNFFLVLR